MYTDTIPKIISRPLLRTFSEAEILKKKFKKDSAASDVLLRKLLRLYTKHVQHKRFYLKQLTASKVLVSRNRFENKSSSHTSGLLSGSSKTSLQ